jgi:hypothetical protein
LPKIFLIFFLAYFKACTPNKTKEFLNIVLKFIRESGSVYFFSLLVPPHAQSFRTLRHKITGAFTLPPASLFFSSIPSLKVRDAEKKRRKIWLHHEIPPFFFLFNVNIENINIKLKKEKKTSMQAEVLYAASLRVNEAFTRMQAF